MKKYDHQHQQKGWFELNADLCAVLASSAIGGIISAIARGVIEYKKLQDSEAYQAEKDEREQIEFYRQKWLEDEDQIDKLRDQVRSLKDKEK